MTLHELATIITAAAEGEKIEEFLNGSWYPKDSTCTWYTNSDYRIAPKVITRTISYPAPVTTPLEAGTVYYVPITSYTDEDPIYDLVWDGDNYDSYMLEIGFVHLSKENAMAHANALITLIDK